MHLLPRLLLIAACVGSLAVSVNAEPPVTAAADFARVKQQFRQSRWQFLPHDNESSAVNKTSAERVAQWTQSLTAEGRWDDIDYTDQTPNFWRTSLHLRRTSELASVYAETRDHGQDDPHLRQTILTATGYWIAQDFRNPNWWQNEIGVPGMLADILLVMEPDLTPELKAGGIKILERSTLTRTGQNLVWQALIVFKTALLQEDAALAGRAYDCVVPQLAAVAPGSEGLQSDHSFHQHGPQQQMGNYGLAFATEMSEWAWIWRGTRWALSDDRLATLRGYLLEGEGTVVAAGVLDISACGRQFFPGAPAAKAKVILADLQIMTAVDPAHAAEYQAVIARDAAAGSAGAPARADDRSNHDFYRSDYLVHRRPSFAASVKMCSRRVVGTEKTNDENLQGRYMADGATFVYRTGHEYTDIFPVWDWRRVPGVTASPTGTALAPAGKMDTNFAGGVSDGTIGAAGLDYHRDAVTGQKSWFFLDDEIICLGAGLTQGDGAPLVTSVEQSLLQGDILAGTGNAPAAVQGKDVHRLTGARWVWHDNQGYVFPVPSDVSMGGSSQTGAWNKVYKSGTSETVSKDVFSLWIDHGTQPGSSYAYLILPGADAKQTAACAARSPVEILRNTPSLQAIRNPRSRQTLAVFFAPGELETPSGKLTVDKPCALILREAGARPQLTVSDPAQSSSQVRLTLGDKTVMANLPQASEAGKSVAIIVPR